jgi:hypothetical protein
MDRTRSLDRRYRRILYGGLAISAAAHAALIGVRFDVPVLSDATLRVEQLAVTPFDAVEVVRMQVAASTSPVGAMNDVAPVGPVADAAPAAPAMSAAATPVAASPSPPAPVEPAVAFEQLTVFDPLSSAPIRPVEFEDLQVAQVSMPVDSELNGEAEDDVELYVPGSIGAAKRAWGGSSGTNAAGGAEGSVRIFGGGGSGGHCPMPGGRIVPPIWK